MSKAEYNAKRRHDREMRKLKLWLWILTGEK